MARAWQMASYPLGMASPDNFRLAEIDLPALAEGEVRVENRYLSVEPAMRFLMNEATATRMAALQIGQTIRGRAVGTVVETRSDALAVGDLVFHYHGWRDVAQGPAQDFDKLPVEDGIPTEYWLASLGMPGVTAYFGLIECGLPKAGETLFVSAAAGSVGSTVLQVGKALGLTVIGSAGGAEKCAVLKDFGADATIDYRAPGRLSDKLKAAAPGGIDVYFDNVGGEHLDAALSCARPGARFAECGMIDMYNAEDPEAGIAFSHMMRIVSSQIRMRGFIVDEFEHRLDEMRGVMKGWIRDGAVRPLLSISEGLERTADTFVGLFQGRNLGKALIRI